MKPVAFMETSRLSLLSCDSGLQFSSFIHDPRSSTEPSLQLCSCGSWALSNLCLHQQEAVSKSGIQTSGTSRVRFCLSVHSLQLESAESDSPSGFQPHLHMLPVDSLSTSWSLIFKSVQDPKGPGPFSMYGSWVQTTQVNCISSYTLILCFSQWDLTCDDPNLQNNDPLVTIDPWSGSSTLVIHIYISPDLLLFSKPISCISLSTALGFSTVREVYLLMCYFILQARIEHLPFGTANSQRLVRELDKIKSYVS